MLKITAFLMTVITFFTLTVTVDQHIKTDDEAEISAISPVMWDGCDPSVAYHDGYYYFCYSMDTALGVKKADSLAKLKEAEGKTVFVAPEGTDYSSQYWAPELHYLDGQWYIYVAADNGVNENHRMYVLKCTTQDPTDPFEMVGKISDSSDKWAIDGTVMEYKNEMYFIWSGWEGDADGQQNLYIAHMSDPVTIDSERVLISKPVHLWEKKGMPINEGPAVLKKGGNVYVVYSASGSWTNDYCLGMLSLSGKDPLNKCSWKKCALPVFSKVKNSVYGPGHCCFVKSADGNTDYIVFHGNREADTGWFGRQIRIQKIKWSNGVPVFGKPLKESDKVYVAEAL